MNIRIGENVALPHNTTIGAKTASSGAPIIANNIDVAANSVITGILEVGDNVIAGPGVVVLHSFAQESIIAGNPARVIKSGSR